MADNRLLALLMLLPALIWYGTLPADAQIGSQVQAPPGQGLPSQTPDHNSLAGQWRCVDGSRNVNNPQGGSHYHEFVILIHEDHTFQAQGVDQSGPFEYQAQGNWRVQQFTDGVFFVAEGQSSHPMFGTVQFTFMTVPLDAYQMAYSFQDQSGLAVASQCQRIR